LTLIDFLPGDFNRDNVVDAADQVVWSKFDGSTVMIPGAGADGNFDGKVTRADWDVWRVHLGEPFTATSSSFSSGPSVPEPDTVLFGIVSLAWLRIGRSNRSRRKPSR
jgi:hypothetical protein